MTEEKFILKDNVYFLRQAARLVKSMPAGIFTHTFPPLYTSGVGSHLRHCIDHYTCFLSGLPDGRIDYDHRDRDPRLETDPVYAARRFEDLAGQLEILAPEVLRKPVACKMDGGTEEKNPWAGSCVKRELQFLISHTVHHFALIAMILRHQGQAVPDHFGIAPSTLKYQQSRLSCAQ